MFGTTDNIPAEPQRPLGVESSRLSTNEAARPLPYFAGTRWMGVTWVGNAFNVRTTPIVRKVGKKSTVTGYNYYASCVALVSSCRVDKITAIRMANELVWEGSITRGAEDYVSITIENRGVARLYWGTETQTLDSLLATSQHSAYRGQSYMVFEDLFFGPDNNTAPNVEVELGRWPDPAWLTVDPNIEHDANPMAVLHELWTNHRFGLGRPESGLDLDSLAAAAEQLDDEGLGFSPSLTRETTFQRTLIELLEGIDGYPTWLDGKLGVGLIRHTDAAIPSITSAALDGDPSIKDQDWDETYNEARVTFKNRDKNGEDDIAKHIERANYVITGSRRTLTLARPWVTRAAVAQRIANAAGRSRGVPQFSGSARLIESEAEDVILGAPFNLTYGGLTLRARCTSRATEPKNSQVGIAFEADRGWANSADYYEAEADALPAVPSSTPEEVDGANVIDAPYGLGHPSLMRLLKLASRGDLISTAYDIWFGSTSGGSYKNLGSELGRTYENWAVRAELTSGYSAATLPIDEVTKINFTVLCPDQGLLDSEWDLEDGLNHTLLAFIGTQPVEIVSLFDVEKLGDTTYRASCVRGLYDTKRTTHSSAAPVWIQLRNKIDQDDHQYFPFIIYLKFQPRFGQAEVPLGDVDPTNMTPIGRSYRPLAPLNLKANGDGYSPTYAAGADVIVTWANTHRERSILGRPVMDTFTTDVEAIKLEIRNLAGDTLLDTITLSPAPVTYTLTAAYLSGIVGTHFTLRAYSVRAGLDSLVYDSISVLKV
jgi:hypothetical protein